MSLEGRSGPEKAWWRNREKKTWMEGWKEEVLDSRITRRYFSFPAYLIFVLFSAIIIMLPTIFYGGGHLILESSGPFIKWYLLYCLIVAALLSAILALQKYLTFDRHVKRLSSAAKRVAEGDFSVYLPIRHNSDDMDYIDTLFKYHGRRTGVH